MKSSILLVVWIVGSLFGCAGEVQDRGRGFYREYNPPWLMAWDGPEEIQSNLIAAIPVGMTRPEVEAVLRQKGVKNWEGIPEGYHDSIAVDLEAVGSPFRYIGEQGNVPHGDRNYALYQPSRISIMVPSYRGVPKRNVTCILYPAPEMGIAIISFADGQVVSTGYVPLPGHEYSSRMFANRTGEH